MTDLEKKILRGALDLLSVAGFHRKNLLARATMSDLTAIVELQRSQYGARYFLNIGFWIHALGAPPVNLAIHKCHYYGRAGEEISDALSFESHCDGDREDRIRTYFQNSLLPLLKSVHEATNLMAWVRDGTLSSPIVLPAAQTFLRLTP